MENEKNSSSMMGEQPGMQTPAQSAPPAPMPETKSTGGAMKKVALVVAALVVLGGGAWGLMTYLNREEPLPHLKIGVMAPFNGDSAAYAYAILKGAQLAKKDLAADTIELIKEDSQCDPKVSPAATTKLINQGVVAIIGDSCSGSTLAALPKVEAAKVVMISGSSSSPKLSIADDFFFRVVPPDQQQGLFLANLANKKGYKNVAIFYSDEDYGQGLAEIFTENFEKLGGKVVASEGAARDVINVTTQADTIAATNPDAVFLLNNSSASSVAFMKQFRTLKADTPFYGSDGLYDSSLITSGGTASAGMIFTVFPTGSQTFKDQFSAEFGDQTSVIAAAQGYDAFKSLYLTIQGGARTGADIKAKLPSISFVGVSSPISFDKFGDVKADGYKYGLLQIKGDEFVNAEE